MVIPLLILLILNPCWALESPQSSFIDTIQIPTILLVCCFSFVTQIFFSKHNVVPLQLVIIIYIVLVMSITQQILGIYGEESNKDITINPFILNILFFPLLTARWCFSGNKYLLIKTLPTILFITTIISGANIVMHAALVKLALFTEWPWVKCFILAVIFSTTQVQYIVMLLNDLNFKLFRAQMYGETIISIAFVLTYFDITVGIFLGFNTESYGTLAWIFFFKVIVGIIAGYAIGLFTTFIIKWLSNNPETCTAAVLSMFIITYILIEFAHASPFCAMLSMALMLMQYRDRMMEDNLIKIRQFLQLINFVANFGIFIYSILIIYSWRILDSSSGIKNGFLNYFIIIMSRGCCFSVAYPMFKWLTPDFNCIHLFMMIWGKVISNTTLILTSVLLCMEETREYAREIVNVVFTATLITHSLNAISFVFFVRKKVLKRKSFNQISNMMSTLKYLYEQKDRYISIWKMKGGIADVRWDVVNELTDIKQPFKKDDRDPINSQMFMLSPRKATCPDCKRIVTAELSTKDKTDMRIEVNRRILKEMHMHLVRTYSMGLVSLECMLIAKKMLAESKSIFINVDELKTYFRGNKLLDAMKGFSSRVLKFDEKSLKVPRKPFRRICYRIIMNQYYRGLIYFSTFTSIYPIIIFILTEKHSLLYFSAVITNILFALMFFLHMVITINAYSFIYLRDGIKKYLSSYWHIFDLIIVIMAISDVAINIMFVVNNNDIEWYPPLYYSRLIRLMVILKILQGQMATLLKIFEEYVDVRIAFGFELVQAFRSCYDEVLMTLSRIIVNNYDLEMECREILEKAQWAMIELMLHIQVEKPWVAINVKTKQVMYATVKNMYTMVNEMKMSGFLDTYEYEKLKNNIRLVEVRCGSIGKKLSLNDDEVLVGIPWIDCNKEVSEFIRVSAVAVNFKPDQIICKEDDYLHGIYIILSGVLKIEYSPSVTTMDLLLNDGRLPIMDYIESNTFDRNRLGIILPGNSIGELSFLTNRPYDAKITSLNRVKTLFIPSTIIERAAANCNYDIIDSLIVKMWKSSIYEMCLWILTSESVFEGHSRYEITQKLERAFVPNLRGYRMLNLNDDIEDVILIDGQAVNLLVKEVYNAPCYLPRTVTSFSISFNEMSNMNSVILIIPTPEANIVSLVRTLENQSVMARESDYDFVKRSTKLHPPEFYDKDLVTCYTTSTIFNPLEMLKKQFDHSNKPT